MNARRGRGRARGSNAIIDAAREILEEIQPATVRAVCYRLFAAGLIPNMSTTSTQKVSRLLVAAREEETIPWEWIVDETRAPERISTWDNPEQIIRAAVNGYRKDYWTDQPDRVEVWSEKGTVRGTLAPVLDEYGVTFRVQHGYGSATAIHQAADDSTSSDKPLTVLYVGDWDPSGLHMSEVDLPERIDRYGGNIDIERIALSHYDVHQGPPLPSFDVETKAKDPRFAWFKKWFGSKCWELDAMNPVDLRERVKGAITERLDMDKWNRAVQVELAEQDSMREFLATWHRTISLPVSKYSGGAS